jgi:hypothetical protein
VRPGARLSLVTRRRAPRPVPEACCLLRPATFPQLRKDFIHVEASCLLPLWVVPERHQELTHVVLCRDKKEGVVEKPVVIGVRGDVGALQTNQLLVVVDVKKQLPRGVARPLMGFPARARAS